MTGWPETDVAEFEAAYSLVLRAGRPDERDEMDERNADPSVELGMVVVRDRLYVRSYRGRTSRWYTAALTAGTGTIDVGPRRIPVSFADPGADDAEQIDAAYRARYAGLSGGITGARGTTATIRIEPKAA